MAKILVVDDSASTREIIRDMLSANGITDILEAEDGKEGLELFEKTKDIGFIIADCHMPIIDGYVMCEKIYDLAKEKSPPVIIVSTETNNEIKAKFKKFGVIGWIIKPFDSKAIGPKLAELIKKKMQRK